MNKLPSGVTHAAEAVALVGLVAGLALVHPGLGLAVACLVAIVLIEVRG